MACATVGSTWLPKVTQNLFRDGSNTALHVRKRAVSLHPHPHLRRMFFLHSNLKKKQLILFLYSIPKKVPPLSQALSHHQLALAASHAPAEAFTSTYTPPSNSGRSDGDSIPPSPSSKANLLPSLTDNRRRSAEERADILRKDPLLTEVEPNKVLCALCRKWVQLRQDSSYCAYPWYQHKSKCVLRQ